MTNPVTFDGSNGGTIVATQDPNTGQPTYILNLPSGKTLGPISSSDFTSGNASFSSGLTGIGTQQTATLSLGNFSSGDVTRPDDIAFLQGLYSNAQSIASQAQQDFQTQDTTAPNTTAADTPSTTTGTTADAVITAAPITVPPVDTSALQVTLPPISDLATAPPTVVVTPPSSIISADVPIAIKPISSAEIASLVPPVILPEIGPTAPAATGASSGITGAKQSATAQATAQDQANFSAAKDWRVRLALAPGANYLYKSSSPGILEPLKATDGVIFPYTPTINVTYAANYDAQSVTHSNYKVYQYQSSSVDSVNVSGDFTCQDVFEANYLLATIHFFRSMTKMFYGQDTNPKNGTPPPLCYIYGMGGYQFDALPLAVTGFTYNLPADVDYIATTGASPAGSPQPSVTNNNTNKSANFLSGAARLLGINIAPGGAPKPPTYPTTPTASGESTTWVPTKIQLSITFAPVQSRNMVSNKFSLQEYGTGNLLRGSKNPGGGMW
jgi:hypothetical protein